MHIYCILTCLLSSYISFWYLFSIFLYLQIVPFSCYIHLVLHLSLTICTWAAPCLIIFYSSTEQIEKSLRYISIHPLTLLPRRTCPHCPTSPFPSAPGSWHYLRHIISSAIAHAAGDACNHSAAASRSTLAPTSPPTFRGSGARLQHMLAERFVAISGREDNSSLAAATAAASQAATSCIAGTSSGGSREALHGNDGKLGVSKAACRADGVGWLRCGDGASGRATCSGSSGATSGCASLLLLLLLLLRLRFVAVAEAVIHFAPHAFHLDEASWIRRLLSSRFNSFSSLLALSFLLCNLN